MLVGLKIIIFLLGRIVIVISFCDEVGVKDGRWKI